jgi:hypothetical protein
MSAPRRETRGCTAIRVLAKAAPVCYPVIRMEERTAKQRPHNNDSLIAWHPAFCAAIRLTFDRYSGVLRFETEYQLTAEPLRMDVLIIKKDKDAVIEKNIAAIFRTANIFEYKSPDDYVSVEDFYKVYGYACLYAALNKVPVTEITLTFVESRYPRKLLAHLKEARGYEVEEKWSGVYRVKGDVLPIQIIETKKLSEEEVWLKELGNDLDKEGIAKVLEESGKKGKAEYIRAYLEAVLQANAEKVKEALGMSKTAITLDQVLEEAGLTAKWEARGEMRGEIRGEVKGGQKKALEIIKKALAKGMPVGDIADITGYDAGSIEKYKKDI